MKQKIGVFCILIIYIVLDSSNLYCQTNHNTIEPLSEKILLYGQTKPSSILFAHFDKTVYLNNESVWFTAFLLNYNKKVNDPSLLLALLINDDDNKSITISHKFVMADGISFGHIVIPDSILPGNYTFVLYTNILAKGKPVDIFTQPVTIKSGAEQSFKMSLDALDTSKITTHKFITALLKASTKEDRPLGNVKVSYRIGNNMPVSVKTDKDGQYLFSIPANQVMDGKNTLAATLTYNKEVKTLRIALPVTETKFSVKFYPEGGNLVHATTGYVGWEVKNANGGSLKARGILMKDNISIDTIETDSYGMGRFRLTPLLGSNYKVKLLGELKDTVYYLPAILSKGPAIGIKNAIANDSLRIRLTSKYPGKFFLIVHNYRENFFSLPVDVGAVGKTIVIDLTDVPKGLNTITLLDSLQRPCAERLFFAHYNRHTLVIIATDKPVYGTREKVNLKLKLSSMATDSTRGIVSISCVQSNRIELKKSNDIESYVYLKHELEAIPVKEKYMGQSAEDKTYLENVLLIRGWRRYKWQEMLETKAADTTTNSKIAEFPGLVRYYGGALKKPVKIMILTDSLVNVIVSDKAGKFTIPQRDLITADDKKAHILVPDSYNNNYSISVSDPFVPVNNLLAATIDLPPVIFPLSSALNDTSHTLYGLEHAINLTEVVIKGFRDDSYIKNRANNGYLSSNECGDYVCRFNILNCPNHANEMDNRPPVIGETYNLIHGGTIIYKGCTVLPDKNKSMLTVDGVKYSREFYGSDYAQFNSSAPDYQSTIYWNKLCFINSAGDTNLSFYTSDITGPFKIIVQGIASHDVIYSEQEFTVKKARK